MMSSYDRESAATEAFSRDPVPEGSCAITDPAWLSTCASDIRAIYFYWKSKAAGRRMPARADIEPFDLVAYLPSIMLVDVFPEAVQPDTPGAPPQRRYVYRLVGTLEVTVRGMDPTGKSVATHSFGQDPELALRNYNAVVDQAEPVLDRSEEMSLDRSLADLEAIFLPLSNDGVNVNMVLVYTVQERFCS
jgi:hypothetical protein